MNAIHNATSTNYLIIVWPVDHNPIYSARNGHYGAPSSTMSDITIIDKESATIEANFKSLSEKWKRETINTSSIDEIISHADYRKIIKMGKSVLILILKALEKEPDHWFFALNSITGEDPIQENDAGHFSAMTEAWLRWGRTKGYIEGDA